MLSAIVRWMRQFRLFRRAKAPSRSRDVILWWEARRIPYNLIVGSAGMLSGLLTLGNAFVTEHMVGEPIGLPDPPLFAFVAVIVYGIVANACFTGGWIAELVTRRVWGDQADLFGEVAFTLGTMFSVLLTLAPAAFVICMGAYAIVFHRGPANHAADTNPLIRCPLTQGTEAATFPGDLPAPILDDFRSHIPTIAGVGDRFNATDVMQKGQLSRRLILVRHAGTRWVIAYEHGGFAYHDHVIGYELADSAKAKLIFNAVSFPGDVCEISLSWLQGAIPAATTAERAGSDW